MSDLADPRLQAIDADEKSAAPTTPVELRLRSRGDWHDAAHRYLLPLECVVADAQSFNGHALVSRLRGMVVAELCLEASKLARRAADIRNGGGECVKFVCQLAGRSRVHQGASVAELEPGRWAVCDPAREYQIEMSRGTRVLLMLVPRSQCQGWLPAAHALVGRSLAPSDAANIALAAVSAYLRAAAPLDAHGERALRELVLALLERALTTELKARGLGTPGERAITLPQLQAYILEHLTDCTLTVARVAQAFGISRRSLYNLFLPSDITPHVYILGARLERACALLRGSESRTLPVAQIARRCGFADPAHFTRAFHTRFGVAPTAWRAHAV